MAYESLIEDMDHVQGDSSPTWFIGLPDNRLLNDGNWSARYVVATKHGVLPILDVALQLNSGTGEGDTYTPNTKFIFEISPAESSTLTGGTKYICAVELSNLTIGYRRELARFKLNVLVGN